MATRSADRRVQIAVPDLVSNSYFPAVAARELGYLSARGVDADVRLIYPVSKAMQALRSGLVDFVAGSAHATLEAFPQWHGAKLLVALSQGMYWFLVVRTNIRAERGDLTAVRGLRIGAAPGPEAGLRRMLLEVGIDPSAGDVEIGPIGRVDANVSFGIRAAEALEAGEVDAFWANGMAAEVAVRRGVGSILIDARRGDGPISSSRYTFPALVTDERTIAHRPPLVASIVEAVVACQAALRHDPGQATRAASQIFPALEASLIATLIERDAPFYEPAISEESVRDLNEFCRSVGLLKGDVPYADVVSDRFSHLWANLGDAHA